MLCPFLTRRVAALNHVGLRWKRSCTNLTGIKPWYPWGQLDQLLFGSVHSTLTGHSVFSLTASRNWTATLLNASSVSSATVLCFVWARPSNPTFQSRFEFNSLWRRLRKNWRSWGFAGSGWYGVEAEPPKSFSCCIGNDKSPDCSIATWGCSMVSIAWGCVSSLTVGPGVRNFCRASQQLKKYKAQTNLLRYKIFHRWASLWHWSPVPIRRHLWQYRVFWELYYQPSLRHGSHCLKTLWLKLHFSKSVCRAYRLLTL